MAVEHLDLGLDIISDMLLNARLPAEEIQREKGVILEEMHLYQDTPMRYVDDIFEELLFGQTSLGKMIIGTENTIKSFSRDMFVNYQEGLYKASNVVVCVAGKIDEAKDLKRIGKIFQRFGRRTGAFKDIFAGYTGASARESPLEKTDQTHLMLGFHGYPLNHPRRFAAELLTTILGSGMSSRLFHSIRERRGLAYYVRAGSQSYTDAGYIAAQAGSDQSKVPLAIKQILAEFKKLKMKKWVLRNCAKPRITSKDIFFCLWNHRTKWLLGERCKRFWKRKF